MKTGWQVWLCTTCENLKTCNLPKPASGVWMCDVPAPDVMTNAQHMLWMLDEFETLAGGHYPGFSTGKPIGMGGSLGRKEATGFGVMFCVREAVQRLGRDLKGMTAAFQGFGNVAQYAVRWFTQAGGRAVCVS